MGDFGLSLLLDILVVVVGDLGFTFGFIYYVGFVLRLFELGLFIMWFGGFCVLCVYFDLILFDCL